MNRVTALDNQTIELTFNKPLDGETAADAGIIPSPLWFLFRCTSGKGLRPLNRYKVKLYLAYGDRLQKQNDYTVRIDSDSVKDYLGNGIESTRERFSGTNKSRDANKIEEAVAISTDAVKLTLSQEVIFSADNLLPANFTLEYSHSFISIKKVPISVIYSDAKTLILKFDSLDYDTPYTLKVSQLTDFSGNIVKGLEKDFRLEAQ